jgi:hypothetical protein
VGGWVDGWVVEEGGVGYGWQSVEEEEGGRGVLSGIGGGCCGLS